MTQAATGKNTGLTNRVCISYLAPHISTTVLIMLLGLFKVSTLNSNSRFKAQETTSYRKLFSQMHINIQQ